eukprot:augustus_masked-scaffold_35-processed-gene-2.64-mRNA-1 protein AED:0.86 eAED:1.00 QI:0/-1/0/1/-1/1/1/0/494
MMYWFLLLGYDAWTRCLLRGDEIVRKAMGPKGPKAAIEDLETVAGGLISGRARDESIDQVFLSEGFNFVVDLIEKKSLQRKEEPRKKSSNLLRSVKKAVAKRKESGLNKEKALKEKLLQKSRVKKESKPVVEPSFSPNVKPNVSPLQTSSISVFKPIATEARKIEQVAVPLNIASKPLIQGKAAVKGIQPQPKLFKHKDNLTVVSSPAVKPTPIVTQKLVPKTSPIILFKPRKRKFVPDEDSFEIYQNRSFLLKKSPTRKSVSQRKSVKDVDIGYSRSLSTLFSESKFSCEEYSQYQNYQVLFFQNMQQANKILHKRKTQRVVVLDSFSHFPDLNAEEIYVFGDLFDLFFSNTNMNTVHSFMLFLDEHDPSLGAKEKIRKLSVWSKLRLQKSYAKKFVEFRKRKPVNKYSIAFVLDALLSDSHPLVSIPEEENITDLNATNVSDEVTLVDLHKENEDDLELRRRTNEIKQRNLDKQIMDLQKQIKAELSRTNLV